MNTDTIVLPFRVVIHRFSAKRKRWSNNLNLILLILASIGPVIFVYKKTHYENVEIPASVSTVPSEVGHWVWYIHKNEIKWDGQMFQLFDRNPATWKASQENFVSCFTEDSQQAFSSEIARVIDNRAMLHGSFHVTLPDATVRSICILGKVSSNGQYVTGICIQCPINAVASHMDVDMDMPDPDDL